MNTKKEKPTKRPRRTNAEIDSDLLEAAKAVIQEVGFNNATIVGIAGRAKVQPNVIYNRYDNLEELFDKLAREYDFWLQDSVKIDPVKFSPIHNCEKGLIDLLESLIDSEIMQKLLVWELGCDNYITRHVADNREKNSKYLLDYFNNGLRDASINFNALIALYIAGIYYLVLHGNISTFCGLDFSKKEGIDLLKETIRLSIRAIYNSSFNIRKQDKNEANRMMISTAKTLFESGVDYKIVKKATGLSDKILISLSPTKKKI